MKNKIVRCLGLLLVFTLAISLAGSSVMLNAGPSQAQASGLEWTQIVIPDEADRQLCPGSDVGPMAISPDGNTIFAAVYDEVGLDWGLLKSTDGGFTWRDTGLANALAAMVPADAGEVAQIKVSPRWSSDDSVFVATSNSVYWSDDRGSSFVALGAVPDTLYDAGGVDVITSLDIGVGGTGSLAMVVGTSTEVYLLVNAVWTAQGIGAYSVLDVGFSPDYATDGVIVAVVEDGSQTVVRTKIGTSNWGAGINDAVIKDYDNNDFASDRARIGFPSDYSVSGGTLGLFVGLSATPVADPLGDVFRIDGGLVTLGDPSVVTDLNVRGNVSPTNPTETNIWDIAVSGEAAGAIILAGTETADPTADPVPPGQFLVYASQDAGSNWVPSASTVSSCKQPTGETMASVAMTSATAYAGTRGAQSAVSATMSDDLASWSQFGLIDTSIAEVTDISPSLAFFSDGTMFVTTLDGGSASLWVASGGGDIWERIYCSSLVDDAVTCVFDMVRPYSDAIFLAESGHDIILMSTDYGSNFAGYITAQQDITAFGVRSDTTIYTGDANGNVYQSLAPFFTWDTPDDTEIPPGDTIVDIFIEKGDMYVGTDNGGVYQDTGSFSFVQVGPGTPGAAGDIASVFSDPWDTDFVYAGIQGDPAKQGIWRFDLGDVDAIWERIADSTEGDITGVACADKGVLYAISISSGTGWRCVRPTSMKEDPVFEEIDDGLGVGDSVTHGLSIVSAGSNNLIFAIGGPADTQIWMTSDVLIKPKLTAPASGSITGDIIEDKLLPGEARVVLYWEEITGAQTYEVQIAIDEEFNTLVDDIYFVGGTPITGGTTIEASLWLGTEYFWRVRVEGPVFSQWSDAWNFTTPLGPGESRPAPLSPESGEEGVLLRPALQWSSVVEATNFELVLAADCNWDDPLLDFTGENMLGAETAYYMNFDLAQNTNYYWKVRAVTGETASPWSDVSTFTTMSVQDVDEEGTPVWVWILIVLGAILILAILVLTVRTRFY